MGAPLWAHALVLALLLVAAMPFVGTHSLFSADEGAAIAQAHLLADGDGWTMAHPFPAADPSGEAFPIELSGRRSDSYAPFVKHPLYAILLAGADKVGGRNAMVLLSVTGTWLAAVLAALLTRRLDRRAGLGVLALWLTGLASPLLFDGYELIAHTLGAACVALAALGFVRMIDRGVSVAAATVVGLAVIVAVLLRTEALLLGVALAAAALVIAWRRRDRTLVLAAVVPFVAAGLATLIERRWTTSIMGGATTSTSPLGVATRGGVVEHLHGLVITMLLPSYRADTAAVLTMVVSVLVIVAGVVIVRRPDDHQGPIVFLGTAVVAGVARLFFAADPISGLVVAFPALVLAVVVAPWRALAADDRVVALVSAAGVFAVLVVATQYSEGGSGEWGGRYFAIGLPLVVPLVALSLSRLPDRLDPSIARTVGVLLVCALLTLPVLAVRTLRSYHRAGDDLVSAVVATAARTPPGDGGLPVVITTDGATARYAVDHLDEGRWLTIDLKNMPSYAARLTELGVRSFTFVTHHREDFGRVSGYRVASVSEPVGGWLVATLQST